MPATSLHGLTRPELAALIERWGFKPSHGARLWRYLYWECAASWSEMPEMPAKVMKRLTAESALAPATVARETHSSDGCTRKYLLALEDGRVIETVLMRYTGRVTACVSSQAGCAMGCVFCATGQQGFSRHLTAAEIVAQAVHVQRTLRAERHVPLVRHGAAPPGDRAGGDTGAPLHSGSGRLRNVVLMGMGEPLHNYDAVMTAVEILRDPNGLALAADRITLSTVGVAPGILRLARERRPVHLAVSLHAANQEERAALVPAAKKWPLDELMAACRTYNESTGRRIFYEWTLIEGVNDTPEHARALGRLLSPLNQTPAGERKGTRSLAQVNLIPLNPTPGFSGAPTRTPAADCFQRILTEEFHLPSTVRQRRGIDIAAGCGQLAQR